MPRRPFTMRMLPAAVLGAAMLAALPAGASDRLDDAFVDAMLREIPRDRDLREVPQARARPLPRALAHYARLHPDRDEAIAAAFASGGYTLREIGDYFRLHYSRVSKIVRVRRQASAEAKGKT